MDPKLLVLSDSDVADLMTPVDYLEAMELAFSELGRDQAVSRTRTDSSVRQRCGNIYRFKSMDGIIPSLGICALRVVSDAIFFSSGDYGRWYDKTPETKYNQVAFILLFDVESTFPIALIPDRELQRMRVGCTSGIAARRLARDDARILGVLGSGWQAMAQVLAMVHVRPIREIVAFSPTKEHRERFSQEVGEATGLRVRAASSPKEVSGADIVSVATNSTDPVIFRDWLSPGCHITTVRFPNVATEVYRHADVVITNQRPPNYWRPKAGNNPYQHDFAAVGVPTVYGDEPRLNPTDPDYLDFAQIPSLPELIAGDIPGRTAASQITLHANNIGLGVQFAAAGAELYKRARAAKRGYEISANCFFSRVQ